MSALVSANRVLVKIRPSGSLKIAESRVNLRPLYDMAEARAGILGIGTEPQWYIADLPIGRDNPWDIAHARIAGQLGISESDIVFAEPDIVHNVFIDPNERQAGQAFAVGEKCECAPQDKEHGKACGPEGIFAWHLGDDYTQLERARNAIEFSDPRTRIAHLDTGYYPPHCTTPEHLLSGMERNFVEGVENPCSAADPDNRLLIFDNSGHGTGTISILAGGKVPGFGNACLGGAPEAEVLPLRICDSVVLIWTSSLASALAYAVARKCDVVSLSMGGLPSRTWREAVDAAYLKGVCMVAAAGNNANGIPTRHIVYPARYGRVLAVCGVMADHQPYTDLKGLSVLEGNYGPDSKMGAAIAAYTPNIPWACFGCRDTVRLNGEGTSAATPQVAAAAALWFEKYKNDLPRNWQRVEAVRHALFTTAKDRDADPVHLGNGILQASDALAARPVLGLPQTKSDSDSFPFLRVITGLGIAAPSVRERMFNLEIAQRWMLNPLLQKIVPDPDATKRLGGKSLEKFMEAVIDDENVSAALRKHLKERYRIIVRGPLRKAGAEKGRAPEKTALAYEQPALSDPPHRRIRVYAVDPTFSTRLETAGVNEVALKIRWEPLKEGPSGEYIAVEEQNAGSSYSPVDLNDPRLLAQDGWAPSEGNPQFHEQMVYAVAMKTIEHFEYALGRPVLWRPRSDSFVGRLTVRPHAFNQANAYYSPREVSLLFGYFEASSDDPGDHMPGSRVFTCLSHDIIAHETTHAVLDGMHRSFNEPTNPDVLALHEAFADIVALMQHFTIPEILESEIGRTRGDIETESMLGSLAIQFGRATGSRSALRNAIGAFEDGRWRRFVPDPADYKKRLTPHGRGAVLVAAVFDAFIAIYKERIADLLRIYTGGTGVLPQGALHPDLTRRLADEAVKSAKHVLNICIRALDYLPPVDVTFFEFLRGLITADFDLVSEDPHNYRVAFVEAFRRRGIYPVNIDAPSPDTPLTLSVDTLRWHGIEESSLSGKDLLEHYDNIIKGLKGFADACLYMRDRGKLFMVTNKQRAVLHDQLEQAFAAAPEFAAELGLDPGEAFDVHELRQAMRVSPDGKQFPQIIIALTQAKQVREGGKKSEFVFRGGSTLVLDLAVPEVKYRIVKDINSQTRRRRTADFVRETEADPLRALFFSAKQNEPFAALHSITDGDW